MILKVIQHYFPYFDTPAWDGWNKVLCPFHMESNPSASINLELGRFHCFGCGMNEDAAGIVKYMEGVNFAAAKRRVEEITGDSSGEIPERSTGKSRRKVFKPSWS